MKEAAKMLEFELAAALRDNATLTIRMDRGGELSTVDCQRLSKSRPGQIRFWF